MPGHQEGPRVRAILFAIALRSSNIRRHLVVRYAVCLHEVWQATWGLLQSLLGCSHCRQLNQHSVSKAIREWNFLSRAAALQQARVVLPKWNPWKSKAHHWWQKSRGAPRLCHPQPSRVERTCCKSVHPPRRARLRLPEQGCRSAHGRSHLVPKTQWGTSLAGRTSRQLRDVDSRGKRPRVQGRPRIWRRRSCWRVQGRYVDRRNSHLSWLQTELSTLWRRRPNRDRSCCQAQVVQ